MNSQLEELLKRDNLLSGMDYDNPTRDPSYFFDFVRGYGEKIGWETLIMRLGFQANLKFHYYQLKNFMSGDEAGGPLHLLDSFFGITISPLLYPLIGGTVAAVNPNFTIDEIRDMMNANGLKIDEKTEGGIVVFLSSYHGLRSFIPGADLTSDMLHEYHHAYHYFLTRDLKKRGLITIDGFSDIDHESITPLIMTKAPSQRELKDFERKIVSKIKDTYRKY